MAGPGRTSGAELASGHWLVADAEGKRRTGASPPCCSRISLDGCAPHVALRGDREMAVGVDELSWNATVSSVKSAFRL
jgi:hypothetical protein